MVESLRSALRIGLTEDRFWSMQPWSLRLALDAADERETAHLNHMITAAFQGVVIEHSKQKKPLSHYLMKDKSARASEARQSGEQKWSDLRALFGA